MLFRIKGREGKSICLLHSFFIHLFWRFWTIDTPFLTKQGCLFLKLWGDADTIPLFSWLQKV
ncbi:hypothetical protein EGT74_00265 [Chitinophaga lutea]|uniref:Uncharacterized protein n=1 Tax=Chitinophaga lutea TaxID=2488634 RepID=A0A3N4PX24_9BACT|nr:hypothetical protein EGT74_00265 [Chitinophaga lutea]